MYSRIKVSFFLIIWIFIMADSSNLGFSQRPGINQDESKVPEFTLPKLLVCNDGSIVDSVQGWEARRRGEVLQLFADHVYGNFPVSELNTEFLAGSQWEVFEGNAIRKEVTIRFGANGDRSAVMLITIPKSNQPVPCFVGYNFNGNHTTTDDAKVSITTSWVRENKKIGTNKNRASEKGRGTSASRWPYREIINQGYAVATMYYGDVDPDFDDQFQNGIHPLFPLQEQDASTKNRWGSIGAWGWAISRALDFLQTDDAIDGQHVAVIGHSRLGKTALWAGATDQRFWITISNNSGCGGAALHRRRFGETVKKINTNFPHWFCDQFTEYNDNEDLIPVDQHMLIALMAPRPVYVASASEDLWADPKGEYLSVVKADDLYTLYGDSSMPTPMPDSNTPITSGLRGYHLRSGKHNITLYDWQQYIKFANRHIK